MLKISIGHKLNSLNLSIHGRVSPNALDYWDANWLHCTAEVSTDSLREKVDWQLRNEDLARFLQRLEEQNEEALLDTIDGWLDVRVIRGQVGDIGAKCQLVDLSEGGNALEFELPLSDMMVSELVHQLRDALHQFPVVGMETT